MKNGTSSVWNKMGKFSEIFEQYFVPGTNRTNCIKKLNQQIAIENKKLAIKYSFNIFTLDPGKLCEIAATSIPF